MSKILYPNGTEVAFKEPDTPRRFVVKSYTKGASKPYNLVAVKDSSIKKTASVDEICKFVNHRYSVNKRRDSDVATTEQAYTPSLQNSMTPDKVTEIIRKEMAEMSQKIDQTIADQFSAMHDHLNRDAEIISRSVVEDVDETA